MSREVVLFSSGMDSLIAWEYLGRPDRLYVKLNHRYQDEELVSIMKLGLPGLLKVGSLQGIGIFEKDDAEIPLRNLYLAMIAANMGYDKIWLAVQKDEMSVKDRTREFMSKTSDMLSYLLGKPVSVDTPFGDMDKSDMVKWYRDSGKDMEKLMETWACYTPIKGKPCGNCGACFRRYVAFMENGIDPGYVIQDEIRQYYRSKLKTYSKDRVDHMRKYL